MIYILVITNPIDLYKYKTSSMQSKETLDLLFYQSHTPFTLSHTIDLYSLLTISQVNYKQHLTQNNYQFDQTNDLHAGCSSASTPCPEGCQEIADCVISPGASCGTVINLYQYTLSQAISLVQCSCKCQVAASNADDNNVIRKGIVDLYNSTGGSDWFVSTNWDNPSLSYCSYFGVYCNSVNSVMGLGSIDNNLIGTIPTSLPNIQFLQSSLLIFRFTNNMLTGTIPSAVGRLRNLNDLTLSSNGLEGRCMSMRECVSVCVCVVWVSLTYRNILNNIDDP